MKTVGILTTFRQPNWGSVLQAYALQQIIDSFGHKSYIIDYIYPNEYHFARGKKKIKQTFRNRLGKIKRSVLSKLSLRPHDMMHFLNKFIKYEMRVTKKFATHRALHNNPPKFDIYVSGSDQIWNPNTMMGDMSYMFDFVVDKPCFAYSSSFSCSEIHENMIDDYRKNLSRFKFISVRENNGVGIIKKLLNKEVKVVLDPTLLISKETWLGFTKKAKIGPLPPKYILCYMLAYTYNPNESMALLLEKIQNEYNMPVIFLKSRPSSFKGNIFERSSFERNGIEEFLSLINKASIVISSSFHGVAFSLNFGKPLIALTAKNSDDRIYSLMNNVGLLNNLVYTDEVCETNLNPYYNVNKEQSVLQTLRNNSLIFLQNSLSGC